jgi:putative SOS response-associated peptidase YedK
MCGRYSITVDKNTIEYHFNAKFVSGAHEFHPTYNAAPSQLLPIITTYAPSAITLGKWGFVPEDFSYPKMRPQNNARLETAATKPSFRTSFAGRHCLVITDGYYEWDKKKQPYRFVLKSGEPFALAGIYARGENENDPMTFAILTTEANDVMRPVHDRMPVMLRAGHEKDWLPTQGVTFFNPFPAELMTAYPVTPKMNKASYNEPAAITPLQPASRNARR